MIYHLFAAVLFCLACFFVLTFTLLLLLAVWYFWLNVARFAKWRYFAWKVRRNHGS